MKNIRILLIAFIFFSCGDNKPKQEEKLIVGKSLASEQGTFRSAIDENTFYLVDANGDTLFVTDTVWKKYIKPVDTVPNPNLSPVVNAGADQIITLPVNSVTLSGTALDPEGGKISSFAWSKLSGVGGTITTANAATTTVTGLTAGSYVFRLIALDSVGLSGSDNVSITVLPQVQPPSQNKIEGYGANVTGGSGSSTVIHITNLNQLASSIGSNKTIIIDVSGAVSGGFNLSKYSNLTIDAYTSKQDVTINGGSDGMNIDGCSNIIIRGLRFINCSNDGLNATGSSHDIVFDHCSSYNNRDGSIDLAAIAGKNFTVQYCIMGKNNGSGNMLITTQNASVHHNLFIGDGSGEGAERNPFAHSNYSPKGSASNPNFDFRNNIITAAGRYASGCGYGAVGNFVNNYYTSTKSGLINLCADPSSCSSAYVSGNFNQPNSTGGTKLSSECTIPTQYKVTTTDATTAAIAILQSVGPYQRDSYEQGKIDAINISGTPPTPTACTGYIYSAWSACNNGTQTRTVTGTTPNGCIGQPGSQPVLSQSCSGTPPTDGTRGPLILDQNFESAISSGTLWSGFDASNAQWCCSYSVTSTTTHAHEGSRSFRGEVRAGDPSAHSGWRAEITPTNVSDAGDMWYGFSIYFETYDGDGRGHVIQWHPDNSSGSLEFGLWGGKNWDLVTNPEGDETAVHHDSGIPIVKNKWHDVVIHVNWSTGQTQFWLNGALTTNITVNWNLGRYLKFGMNRWSSGSGSPTSTWVIDYDNIRVAKNGKYADVAPVVTPGF